MRLTSSSAVVSPPPRRWRPALSLQVTAALHAGGVLALAWRPEHWHWVAATLVANHAVLFGNSLAPCSRLLGPNMVRLPAAAARRNEIALTFDDGPDPEVTPRVLDILDTHGARASFFCIGERARAFPAVAREIVRRGHSVENHSLHHSTCFGWYGLAKLKNELRVAQAVLGEITGRAPEFFRAPFGMRNPLLDPALAGCGLWYVSWTRRAFDVVDENGPRVLRRLTRRLAAGDLLVLHDGSAARTRRGPPTVLAVLQPFLERVTESGFKAVSLPAACRACSAL
jgi:peptidoglycan/xylan/chitin deacetylase (PgdA/CDA1 family)